MDAPAPTHTSGHARLSACPELSEVRLLDPIEAGGGVTVPAGSKGTVLGVGGAGREVESDLGLATVDAEDFVAAVDRG